MRCVIAAAIAALIIAGAYALSHRYTVRAIGGADQYTSIWRVDQWTGNVVTCDYGKGFTAPACTAVKMMDSK